jgi:hypothetical protein
VRDEKMLEKLTTHDIQDVTYLFSLADKCARAIKGHAWHTPPAPEAGKGAKPKASAAAQGGSSKNKNNKKKKVDGNNQSLAGAPTTTAAVAVTGGGQGPRGDMRPHQASGSDDKGTRCPVHNSMHHNTEECREIKKLTEHYHEQLKQQCNNGVPSRQREGKQEEDPEEDKEDGLGFQKAKRDLRVVYGHSDSKSSDNERRKTLYVMFGGSWDITSCRIIKNLRREVAAVAPAPKVAPHHRWMETSISFYASDCPKSMVGVGQLPLLISPTIINIKMYYVLIDGGAALNLISLVAFKKL